MEEKQKKKAPLQQKAHEWAVTILSLAVGWHFLYEGLWKVFQGGAWSARVYLEAARGPAAGVFQFIARSDALVAASDFAVAWGLVAIGLGLISGVLARWAAASAVLLLSFFVLAQPPEPFVVSASFATGRFFLFDVNVLEIVALLMVVAAPAPSVFALLRPLKWKPLAARGATALAFLVAFAFAWRGGALKPAEAAQTSATVKRHEFKGPDQIVRPLSARTTLGRLSVPRLALGGEYFDGRAHGRDLLWTDSFMAQYNRPETIRRTVEWALSGGIDVVFGSPALHAKMREARSIGLLTKFVSDCTGKGAFADRVKKSVRDGAAAVVTNPDETDALAAKGDLERAKLAYVELKNAGVPFGIAARKVETLAFCVQHGFLPDFWCISYHPTNYPSARPEVARRTKSTWCTDPARVRAFVSSRKEPWVAFDVTAYGAVPLPAAIKFAADAGAACVVADVLDFQVVDAVDAAVRIFDAPAAKDKEGKK